MLSKDESSLRTGDFHKKKLFDMVVFRPDSIIPTPHNPFRVLNPERVKS
jgi:hypothetical protein